MNKPLLSLLARTGLIPAEAVEVAAEGDQLVRGVCPVHEGADNPTAFALKTDYWVCNTFHCERDYGARLEGLVVALAHRYGDEHLRSRPARDVRFREALRWLRQNADRLRQEVFADWPTMKGSSGQKSSTWNRRFPCSRTFVVQNLVIPSCYFVKRGFAPATLREYDIGHPRNGCLFPNLATWTIVPMYDLDDTDLCVGYVARNSWGCAGNRWRFSKGFPAGQRLFNYARARQTNSETGRLVVVEGVPDALRCIEAGFPETVALLGSALYNEQVERLRKMRLDHVAVVADNDEAGSKLARQFKKIFSAQVIEPPASFKDIGDMCIAQAREFLRSTLPSPKRGAA